MTKQEFKQILDEVKCNDISIQENVSDGKLLIIVCETESQSTTLFNIIQTTKYIKRGFAKSNTDLYTVILYFDDMEYQLICRTTKTIDEYPSIRWLENKLVKFITAGVFIGFNNEGMPKYSYKRVASLLDSIHKN